MNRQLRATLQKLLTLLSFLIAGAATAFWWQYKQADAEIPMWLLGVLGYGWTFGGFMLLNLIGKTYARKVRPVRRRKKVQPAPATEAETHEKNLP